MSTSRRSATLSFRALLAAALLLLLGGTVAVLVSLSTWFATRNFRDLTQTIAEQTLAHVEANVQQLLQKAVDQNRQFVQLVNGRSVSATNFPTISNFLAESLVARPSLARLTLILEPSGEFVQAERKTNGRVRIREGHPLEGTNSHLLSVIFWDWRGNQRIVEHATNVARALVREDEGFREARSTGRSWWTRAYPWDDPTDGARWGIRFASLATNADGSISAVCAASLTLGELNRYLRQLDNDVPGYVAVIEEGTLDRPPRLIGHPDPAQTGRPLPTNLAEPVTGPVEPLLRAYVRALQADPRYQAGELRNRDFGREFVVGSTNYLGSFRRLQNRDDPPWILAMIMPVSEVAGGVEENLHWAAVAALAFLTLATWVALALARRIAKPMRQLSADAYAMSQLKFETSDRPLSKIREVRQLEQALGDARSSLRSFRKYVPADVVNNLVSSGVEATLGGLDARLTILFSDVVDFTRLAGTVSAQKLVEHLGEYLAAVSTVIQQNGGTVDKFIGDGVMAFWGAPKPNPNHAFDACVTAWRLQQKLDAMNLQWRAQGKVAFPTRVGVNTGSVIVGNIGSETRMNYTAVGDPVNVASRLESLNRVFGTRILLSEETRLAAGDALLTRPVARVAVKGSDRGFVVYELLGLELEPNPSAQRLADLTATAFLACEQGHWQESLALYGAVLSEFPQDGVALAQREFVASNEKSVRSGDSEVVRRMTTK